MLDIFFVMQRVIFDSVSSLTSLFSRCFHPKPVTTLNHPVTLLDFTRDSRLVESERSDDVLTHFVEVYYGPFLLQSRLRWLVLALLFAYWTGAIYGLTRLEEGLEGAKLVPEDHYYGKFYYAFRDLYLARGQRCQVVFNNPPDLSISNNRRDVMAVVRTLEGSEYFMGPEGTTFFLKAFEGYVESYGVPVDEASFWNHLNHWARIWAVRKEYGEDMKWRLASEEESSNCGGCSRILTKFRFHMSLRNISSFTNRIRAVEDFRRIAAATAPHLNVTSYHIQWRLVDQQLSVVPNTVLAIGIALLAMFVISAVAFGNVQCVVLICVAIISIDIGVIGYCSLASINMDSISMITFTMSVGFSIDYSAHVVHGYTTARGSSRERAISALRSMSIPVTQGAFSTLVGMLVLVSIRSYMVRVFYMTLLCVVLFGLLHACVFLPVLLASEDWVVSKRISISDWCKNYLGGTMSPCKWKKYTINE